MPNKLVRQFASAVDTTAQSQDDPDGIPLGLRSIYEIVTSTGQPFEGGRLFSITVCGDRGTAYLASQSPQ
jgi:hypothetical protein